GVDPTPTQGAVATDTGLIPVSVAADSAGDLFISTQSSGVWIVPATSGTHFGAAMTAGHIYQLAASTAKYGAIRVDQHGNLVDANGNLVQVVAATAGTFYGQAMAAGHAYTVAGGGTGGLGDGGPAVQASLLRASGLAITSDGSLIIADSGHGRVRLVAERSGTFYGQKMTAGHIYAVAGAGPEGFSGDGGPALDARFELWNDSSGSSTGLAVDHAGNLVFADMNNERIRLVAAGAGTFYGQKMKKGDIYTVAGDGGGGDTGDGGPAVKAQLPTAAGAGLAVDAHDNIVIATSQDGLVRVVAATTGTFYGQKMKAGDIYRVAGTGMSGFSGDGGPALKARMGYPRSVAVDARGNLLIADSFNYRVRAVAAGTGTFYGQKMKKGDIYTIAGNGTDKFAGDGSLPTRTGLAPTGVSVDSSGNLLITDEPFEESFLSWVRVVAARAGTFYGVPMKADRIYSVAGDGTRGFSGDGGPATRAALDTLQDAVASAVGLLVSDIGALRVLRVEG
ncbi:MAG: hypothetical protein ACRDRJ_16090, partial [Streptosporangiaceae bacterium]